MGCDCKRVLCSDRTNYIEVNTEENWRAFLPASPLRFRQEPGNQSGVLSDKKSRILMSHVKCDALKKVSTD
jgi:hypothetical protein